MNIIELAKQAGLVRNGDFGMKRWEGPQSDSISDQDLKRFADLVAAQEREACAKLCNDAADDGTEGLWDVCCFYLAKKIITRGNT